MPHDMRALILENLNYTDLRPLADVYAACGRPDRGAFEQAFRALAEEGAVITYDLDGDLVVRRQPNAPALNGTFGFVARMLDAASDHPRIGAHGRSRMRAFAAGLRLSSDCGTPQDRADMHELASRVLDRATGGRTARGQDGNPTNRPPRNGTG